jgi:hypothetical protein
VRVLIDERLDAIAVLELGYFDAVTQLVRRNAVSTWVTATAGSRIVASASQRVNDIRNAGDVLHTAVHASSPAALSERYSGTAEFPCERVRDSLCRFMFLHPAEDRAGDVIGGDEAEDSSAGDDSEPAQRRPPGHALGFDFLHRLAGPVVP